MSREPKFRAFDQTVAFGRMIDVTELKYNENGLALIIGYAQNDKEPVVIRVTSHTHLLEFIGLQDKNGKDIYHGDGVKFQDPNLFGEVCQGLIGWLNCGCWCVTHTAFISEPDRDTDHLPEDLFPWEVESIEVIGNIHENPELLEVGS